MFSRNSKSLNYAFKKNPKEYLLSIVGSSNEEQINAGYQVSQICK